MNAERPRSRLRFLAALLLVICATALDAGDAGAGGAPPQLRAGARPGITPPAVAAADPARTTAADPVTAPGQAPCADLFHGAPPGTPATPAGARCPDPALSARFAALALECVHREYPGKIAHVMSSDADVKPPRELTPAFFGCYDWHSAVHGHWLLARLARFEPEAPWRERAMEALGRSFQPAKIAAEAAYLGGEGRAAFERPYGLAWLLQLASELRAWDVPQARAWSSALEPLERAARDRLAEWMPKLTHPIRIGEHDQTAFSFGLALDWARAAADTAFEDLLVTRIQTLYGSDRDCPMGYEPGGQDFLSPCLAEADLMRRVLPPERFASWLGGFLPAIPRDGSGAWLPPAVVTDRADPKLAHLDGLNLSRAWMLEGIAADLPEGDLRLPAIAAAASAHRAAGLASVTGEHYEGGHWLASFATYLVTGRGLPSARPAADRLGAGSDTLPASCR